MCLVGVKFCGVLNDSVLVVAQYLFLLSYLYNFETNFNYRLRYPKQRRILSLKKKRCECRQDKIEFNVNEFILFIWLFI